MWVSDNYTIQGLTMMWALFYLIRWLRLHKSNVEPTQSVLSVIVNGG